MNRKAQLGGAVGVVLATTTLATLSHSPAAAGLLAKTWYVDADAAPGGNGSTGRPFSSLEAVELASAPGDTIRVLPSALSLDDGLRLKQGQALVGDGPAVTGLGSDSEAPTLVNTGSRLDGDAVRLADGVTVSNLRISKSTRGGIYGLDVSNVRITGNDVSGHNTSCTQGFLIPQFNAPTNIPGVGIPIVGGLPNGWAGIMVDGATRTGGTALISGNHVHDAECGDGIDVRTWGTASYRVTISDNDVHGLRQGENLKSVLAIGLQARDTSRLEGLVSGNRQSDLGNPDELNFAIEGADSEGVFLNGVGPATLTAVVEDNHYTNEDGVGGFSANGLEAVTMGDGSRLSVVVRDSYFSGSPGDVIEEGALGTNARIDMRLERVTAERSTGIGDTFLLPFNNGDCVLAGSLGAGNDVRLTVRDSVLRNCRNNGLAIGSNVVNGTGPTANISLDVDRTSITGNRGGNLGIRNFTGLRNLSIKVQRSNLAHSPGLGSSLADVTFENFGSTGTSRIDLGGGAFGSLGGNCLRTGLLVMNVIRYAVVARKQWWGRAAGAEIRSTTVLGGSLDKSNPLATRPTWCG